MSLTKKPTTPSFDSYFEMKTKFNIFEPDSDYVRFSKLGCRDVMIDLSLLLKQTI